ncbi:MAG: serine/threonine protein kinase [Planctomycetes bacterium]|nr:serine/threonine protein kinase [Planctomycetota bacterium]
MQASPTSPAHASNMLASNIHASSMNEVGAPAIPGYEVLGLLGQGGMGRVYKARDLRLGRVVALKIISSQAQATPEQLARFQAETQALAKLNHPHIVQIFEVNKCDGVPFFSLEFLEGGSLDRKLAGKPQAPTPAARMLQVLARATYDAHSQGIVHRDLKPGNILLTREGQPKISDFGLAKQLDDQSNQTRTGAIIGTPTYMAPEQAAGESKSVGPQTDVYALGVIFYEMLTGRPPHQGLSALETMQLIRYADPVPPKRLQPGLPRALETICLKCLEKQPAKRYASALALAEDLERYLANKPIQARRAGAAERVGKWVQRHPASAALFAVVVLGVMSVTALTLWSNARLREAAERAEARSRLARAVVDDMYTRVAEELLADEPFQDPLRREFLQKASELYREFAQESGRDPKVRQETALAYFRLGQIQRILNQHSLADDAFERAIALQEALTYEFPESKAFRQDLANSYNWRGELYRESGGKLTDAELQYQTARALQEKLVAESAHEPAYRRELARSLYNLGIVHLDMGRPKEAEADLDSAIELLGQLRTAGPQSTKQDVPPSVAHAHELARCLINRGVVYKERQSVTKSADDYGKAIELLQSMGSAEGKGTARPGVRIDLAIAHQNLGNLFLQQNQPVDAVAEIGKALAILQRLADDFPTRPAYGKKLANTHNSMATVLAGQKEFSQAEKQWRQAREILDQLVRDFPHVSDYEKLLGITIGNLAWLRTELKDWAGARGHFEKAVAHLRASLKTNPKNPDCLRALRNQEQSLAETLIQLGDHSAAAAAAAALAAVYNDRPQDFYYAACFVARCVPLAEQDKRLPDAAARSACVQKYAAQAEAMLEQALRHMPAGIHRLPNEQEVFRLLFRDTRVKELLAELDSK